MKDKELVLEHFINLDDNDIWCALKVWSGSDDIVLSTLSLALLNRNLFKIKIESEPFEDSYKTDYVKRYAERFRISESEAGYFCSSDIVATNMYNEADDSIDIMYNDGTIKDIAEASDMLNIQLLSKNLVKYYFSYLRI